MNQKSDPNVDRRNDWLQLLDFLLPPDPSRSLPGGSAVAKTISRLGEECLRVVDRLAKEKFALEFGHLSVCEKEAVSASLSRAEKTQLLRLTKELAESYYLLPEVAQAMGFNLRPPFPEGYEVAEGDWSLLEPVYLRGAIYRETSM